MTDAEIKEYIKDAVELAILRYKTENEHECKLEELGLDLKTHIEHHSFINNMLRDMSKLKVVTIGSSIVGVLTAFGWLVVYLIKNFDKLPK